MGDARGHRKFALIYWPMDKWGPQVLCGGLNHSPPCLPVWGAKGTMHVFPEALDTGRIIVSIISVAVIPS